MITLDEMLDAAITFARDSLIGKKDESLMPTFLVQEKHTVSLIGAPWGDENEKASIIFLMRFMLKNKRIVSYSFVSEAWVATEDPKRPLGLAPSQREDRREVVIINAFERKGDGKVRIYDIERGPDGRVTELKFDDDPAIKFGGRLHNLFRDEDSHED